MSYKNRYDNVVNDNKNMSNLRLTFLLCNFYGFNI